jgi:magnesium transporter
MKTVPIAMDQEEVAYLFRQYGLVSAPVVDGAGRLVGVVTVDDVVHVIDEEAEEDLLKLAGVQEADLYSAVLDTTRSRFTWLLVNLFTAVAASVVIALFEDTLERIVALAVLMPIVASMGGNAGTQTLTVAVRAIAMRDLSARNALRFVGKELIVGLANGAMFAVLAGIMAWIWFDAPEIGAIIAAAMVINLVVAALSGALVPLGLEKIGVDPAVASSVVLTTVTDVIGFFAFLGLATIFLL